MFADLIRRLTAPEADAKLPEPDAKHALAALLVRIAKSDGDYAVEEIRRIDRILQARHGLNQVEAARLRAEAEELEKGAPDTVRFTRAIKNGVAYEDRQQIVGALWEVVLADGERDAEENSLLRMVAPMLGVSDQDSAHARQEVEMRMLDTRDPDTPT